MVSVLLLATLGARAQQTLPFNSKDPNLQEDLEYLQQTLQSQQASISSITANSGSGTASGAFPSSATVTINGNFLAYEVMVSSFDAIGSGVDVGTVTVPASTGTYILDCQTCQATVAGQMVITVNGDSGTNYRTTQMWQEDGSGVSGDSGGGGNSFCFSSRSGVNVSVGWPYVSRFQFTVIGNSRLIGWGDYAFVLSNATPLTYHGHTACNYNGAATVSSLSLKALSTGKWAGHLELRRIR